MNDAILVLYRKYKKGYLMTDHMIIYKDHTWAIYNEGYRAMLDFFAKPSRFEESYVEETIQEEFDEMSDDMPETPLREKLRLNTERLLKEFQDH